MRPSSLRFGSRQAFPADDRGSTSDAIAGRAGNRGESRGCRARAAITLNMKMP
jgi:hypothetical protein